MRLDRISLVAVLGAALVLGQAFFDTPTASAQCDPASETCTTVGADGKGILGGGILGAEIGFIVPALIVSAGARELDEAWAWILFPAIGAAGGAVGGYFALEDPQTTDMSGAVTQQGFPEVAVAVLAVSMALIVPTFVGVLALTSYSPGATEDDSGQGASGDEDAAEEGGEAEESAMQSAVRRTLAGGPGLLRFDGDAVLLGMPMVHSSPTFTAEERAHMRLTGSQDVRIPLVSGTF
ncbi:MAG TPA: hypothetical protein RMH99_05365 [Sandaracinaceae bacterium LLY-WYZ-13_1]|nr:hypothetical protein [Sandaracinaceae bacterium LLY-WYZ-13_1]